MKASRSLLARKAGMIAMSITAFAPEASYANRLCKIAVRPKGAVQFLLEKASASDHPTLEQIREYHELIRDFEFWVLARLQQEDPSQVAGFDRETSDHQDFEELFLKIKPRLNPNLAREVDKVLQAQTTYFNWLIERNLRLAVFIARKCNLRAKLEEDEIVARAIPALRKAASMFRPELGYQFSTYAAGWIKSYMFQMRRTSMIRLPHALDQYFEAVERLVQELRRDPSVQEIARETGFSIRRIRDLEGLAPLREAPASLDAPLGAPGDESGQSLHDLTESPGSGSFGDSVVSKAATKALLDKAGLTGRERNALEAHFGLNGRSEESCGEIGRRLGMTREGARQIVIRALSKLRKAAGIPASPGAK